MTTDRFRLVAAVHLLLVRDGRVLVLRRRNTGYEDGNYSVPAGHLDGGETVAAAAAREAGEEVGLALDPATLRVVGVMHRRAEDERVDFFVAAFDWAGEPANREPAKCDELRWADPAALPANVIPYVRRAISLGWAGDRPWFDAFGWE